MSPNGIERLDRPPGEREFDGKLMPTDIFLSDAMATSAAAVDHHMGARESDDASFRDLKVMLGVAMGTAILGDARHEAKRNCCVQVRIKHTNKIIWTSKNACLWNVVTFRPDERIKTVHIRLQGSKYTIADRKQSLRHYTTPNDPKGWFGRRGCEDYVKDHCEWWIYYE